MSLTYIKLWNDNEEKASSSHQSSTENMTDVSKQETSTKKSAGQLLYDQMKRYLVTQTDRIRNDYPLPSGIKGECLFPNTRSFNHRRQNKECWRCKKKFVLYENGEFERMNDSCYSKNGFCKYHVHRDNFYDCSEYLDSLGTMEKGEDPGIYSLDCEMCYTVVGMELIRVSVVDFDNNGVYDSLVLPSGRILDYNTKWSGVDESIMEGVTTNLKDVHADFLKKFSSDTIFVGHSLENDLKALRIIHNTVIDTSLLFPHRRGWPFKRALRNIVSENIGLVIQNSGGKGHDSIEDAKACIELMKWKLKRDTGFSA